jgi:hypothetical protein
MNTLTVKIPAGLDSALAQASERAQVSKSELVRRAVAAYLGHVGKQPAQPSALDLAGDLVGCFGGGPPDLSFNPRHLDDFGKP